MTNPKYTQNRTRESQFRLFMTIGERDDLHALARQMGISASEILRRGIEVVRVSQSDHRPVRAKNQADR